MNPFPPYPTSAQPQAIKVPRYILYKSCQYNPEDGPWGMPPYAEIFGVEVNPITPRRAGDGDHRPRSVLPPFVRARPITRKILLFGRPRRLGDPPAPGPPPPRSLILVRVTQI